nr:MAG TPA: hypothetical protein [Caudoviricetes sp.]
MSSLNCWLGEALRLPEELCLVQSHGGRVRCECPVRSALT